VYRSADDPDVSIDAAFQHALSHALAGWSIPLSEDQGARMWAHFQNLVEVNRSCNLTRITSPEDAAILHYADSLAILPWAARIDLRMHRVLDLGTGAGFPAVPLAIMRTDWQITAIDATAKKAAFVQRMVTELDLANLICKQCHSDHWRSAAGFDLVVSRALAPLNKCLEAGERFLGRGGYVVTYKTPHMSSGERADADTTSKRLNLDSEPPHRYTLVSCGEEHHRLLDIRRKRV
jgi:16S rRNA (guanine527-N7)-methyltransferase